MMIFHFNFAILCGYFTVLIYSTNKSITHHPRRMMPSLNACTKWGQTSLVEFNFGLFVTIDVVYDSFSRKVCHENPFCYLIFSDIFFRKQNVFVVFVLNREFSSILFGTCPNRNIIFHVNVRIFNGPNCCLHSFYCDYL